VLNTATLRDKILGSLAGACLADALGAPTEQRSIREIREMFGGRVETFVAPPADSPFAHGKAAGHITDDSSQLLMLAEAYIRHGGVITPEVVADMLIRWSGNPEYFPHFAGPSTRAAIELLKAGADPRETGKRGRLTTEGTSNGGAMRVAPAGLVHAGNVEAAVRDAHINCIPSHHTNIGVAGAGAIAASVATALLPTASLTDIVRAARAGATLGAALGSREGRHVAGPSVAARIDLACSLALRADDIDEAVEAITATVGTGLAAAEACPAAVGFVVAAGGDPYLAAIAATNAGDDSDTVGCMAGSIAGALSGIQAIPEELYKQVCEVNNLDLEALADRLTPLAERSLQSAARPTARSVLKPVRGLSG